MRRVVTIGALVTSALLLGANAYAGGDLTKVSGPSPFPAGCSEPGPGTLHMNGEVQPHLAVDPRNPLHLVSTFQQDRWSSIASQGVLTATSFDGGRTWKRATPPVSECSGGNVGNGGDFKRSTDSWTSIAPNGTAYLATLSLTKAFFEPGSQHAIQVSRSTNGGVSWGNPTVLVRDGGETVFNDLPSVTADPTDSRYVYVVWTKIEVLNATDFTGASYLARSTDGGRTWEAPKPIYAPGVNNQTAGNKIVVRPDGTLVNAYSKYYAANGGFALDIETITSTDKGRTWSAPVKVAELTKVGTKDPETGTPIRDGSDFAQFAMDGRGNLYTAWQDSRFSGGQRNGIVLSRSTDGARTWSAPVAVNRGSSAPAFSPALAARRDGTIGVTYYDLRRNTSDPATLPTDYWLATSSDAGATWSERRVGSFDFATAPKVDRPEPSLYIGDYHGLVAAGSQFIALFPMTTGDPANPTDIFTARR
jgi:Neuraminidase (sialidase)